MATHLENLAKRDRDTEGVEEAEEWGGVSPPRGGRDTPPHGGDPPTRLAGLGDRRKLPGGVRDKAPAENDFSALKHHGMLLVALLEVN